MQIIENTNDLRNIKDNYIKGSYPNMNNSKIIFYGENNLLFCDDSVTLEDCTIEFGGNNSIIFLKDSSHKYNVSIKTFNDSTIFIDSNCYFNEHLEIVVSERTNLVIGKDCMFSKNISILTTDHHPIYDCNTNKRINYSQSIYIGDHVWIGQNAIILKGSKIDSGSIIGAGAIVPGTIVESNSIYAGNPAKCIKNNVFWCGDSVHKWNGEESFAEDTFKYQIDKSNLIDYDAVEEILKRNNLFVKFKFLIKLSNYKIKNRFVHAIKEPNKILIKKKS